MLQQPMNLTKLLKAAVTVAGLVLLLREGAEGLPGTYTTYGPLQGKWLPPSASVATVKATFDNCTAHCVRHNKCNAFAYSRMEGVCVMYSKGRDNRAVKIDGFTLYVQKRHEKDGFILYDSYYIKLERERLTPKEAQAACDRKYFGFLPVIENYDMNLFLHKLLLGPLVSDVTIGVTDEKEEGKWTYFDGVEVGYTNWNWKGVWNLKDRNCAAMTLDGTWVMTDCWQPEYYFCQMPLY